MDKISMMLSAAIMVALAVLYAPNVFSRNHGKVLQNIALWLVIFTGITLVYKTFGPDSAHPLFSLPPAMERPNLEQVPDSAKPDNVKESDHHNSGS